MSVQLTNKTDSVQCPCVGLFTDEFHRCIGLPTLFAENNKKMPNFQQCNLRSNQSLELTAKLMRNWREIERCCQIRRIMPKSVKLPNELFYSQVPLNAKFNLFSILKCQLATLPIHRTIHWREQTTNALNPRRWVYATKARDASHASDATAKRKDRNGVYSCVASVACVGLSRALVDVYLQN